MGANRVVVAHQQLHHGDRCAACGKGNVYNQKEPKALVGVVGAAPLAATAYSLTRLLCNGCGQEFTAHEPEGCWSEQSSSLRVPRSGMMRCRHSGRSSSDRD